MKTIVVLVDSSETSHKLIVHAKLLAEVFKSKIVLLTMLRVEPYVMDFGIQSAMDTTLSAEEIQQITSPIRQWVRELQTQGFEADFKQVHTLGHSVKELMSVCQTLLADLIIVGSRCHGALYNLVLGSTTAEVLKMTTCPVLVIPDHLQKTTAEEPIGPSAVEVYNAS